MCVSSVWLERSATEELSDVPDVVGECWSSESSYCESFGSMSTMTGPYFGSEVSYGCRSATCVVGGSGLVDLVTV